MNSLIVRFVLLTGGASFLIWTPLWSQGDAAGSFLPRLTPEMLGQGQAESPAKKPETPQATTPPAAQEEKPKEASKLSEPAWPVGGIYTIPDTKDLGTLTGISWLSGTKIRGWIDTNYVWNFNDPKRSVVDANQGSSVIKGRNVSIEGRTFDVHHNSFNLSLAEVEIEKVPELGGVGFKLDLAFGETQDIIVDTIKGSVGPSAASDSVSDIDRVFQHASVSYLAPVGNGLRLDVGKFVTHIGGETIETVKNWNYSHSFFYTYAIPFQDTGVHASYAWSDTFYTDLYFLNGWNVTVDNNPGKTFGPSIGWTPIQGVAIVTNYLVGNETTNDDSNTRHLWDTQVVFGPFDRWNFMINYDLAYEEQAATPHGVQHAYWTGVAGYVRYKVCEPFEPSFRVEYYNDADGFTTGVDQELWSLTWTFNMKIGLRKSAGSMLLLRPEIRYDWSTDKFFTKEDTFRDKREQVTLGVGATWLF